MPAPLQQVRRAAVAPAEGGSSAISCHEVTELKGPAHVRVVGSFLLNLLQAELGTGIIEWFFPSFYRPMTAAGNNEREILVSAFIAFASGVLIYYLRRPKVAKWIWTAGVLWLSIRAAQIAIAGQAQSLWDIFSGGTCASGHSLELCNDFLWVTIPLVRSSFYSVGALCCGWLPARFDQKALEVSDPAPDSVD